MDAGRPLATDIDKILSGMTLDSCQNLSLNPPTQYICQENIFAKGWPPKEKTSEIWTKSPYLTLFNTKTSFLVLVGKNPPSSF